MNRKKSLLYSLLTAIACFTLTLSMYWHQALSNPALVNFGLSETIKSDRPIEPIPVIEGLNPEKIALGNRLFHEPKLSQNNQISCASCHDLNKGATDRLIHSVGINGRVGTINAPSIFNSALHFKQFWDGRAQTLEEQIDGPINNELEMGSNWQEVVEKLQQSSDYVAQFQGLYKQGITSENIKDAIATFERSLNTIDSPFDRYLKGDKQALSAKELQGYERFQSYGCVACHQGMLLGGNMFQKFGLFGDYLEDRGKITEADYGRFNVTKKEEDRFMFKVPSLRNVALTYPYFHDGSARTLEEAVKVMIKYQLGREADEEDVNLIIKFLITLTGKSQGVSS